MDSVSVIKTKTSYPAALWHAGRPHADTRKVDERGGIQHVLAGASPAVCTRNTGSLPAVGVSRKKRDSIT